MKIQKMIQNKEDMLEDMHVSPPLIPSRVNISWLVLIKQCKKKSIFVSNVFYRIAINLYIALHYISFSYIYASNGLAMECTGPVRELWA